MGTPGQPSVKQCPAEGFAFPSGTLGWLHSFGEEEYEHVALLLRTLQTCRQCSVLAPFEQSSQVPRFRDDSGGSGGLVSKTYSVYHPTP